MSPQGVCTRPLSVSFDFDELKSIVSGSYNKGELRLDADGGLETINNHVFFRIANLRSNTQGQNFDVRRAVAFSLEEQFGRSADAEILGLVKDKLLGTDAFSALSRDEVKLMISLLSGDLPPGIQSSPNRGVAVKLMLDASRSIKLAASRDEANLILQDLKARLGGLNVESDSITLGTFVSGAEKDESVAFLRSGHLGKGRAAADSRGALEAAFERMKDEKDPDALKARQKEFGDLAFPFVREQLLHRLNAPRARTMLMNAKSMDDLKQAFLSMPRSTLSLKELLSEDKECSRKFDELLAGTKELAQSAKSLFEKDVIEKRMADIDTRIGNLRDEIVNLGKGNPANAPAKREDLLRDMKLLQKSRFELRQMRVADVMSSNAEVDLAFASQTLDDTLAHIGCDWERRSIANDLLGWALGGKEEQKDAAISAVIDSDLEYLKIASKDSLLGGLSALKAEGGALTPQQGREVFDFMVRVLDKRRGPAMTVERKTVLAVREELADSKASLDKGTLLAKLKDCVSGTGPDVEKLVSDILDFDWAQKSGGSGKGKTLALFEFLHPNEAKILKGMKSDAGVKRAKEMAPIMDAVGTIAEMLQTGSNVRFQSAWCDKRLVRLADFRDSESTEDRLRKSVERKLPAYVERGILHRAGHDPAAENGGEALWEGMFANEGSFEDFCKQMCDGFLGAEMLARAGVRTLVTQANVSQAKDLADIEDLKRIFTSESSKAAEQKPLGPTEKLVEKALGEGTAGKLKALSASAEKIQALLDRDEKLQDEIAELDELLNFKLDRAGQDEREQVIVECWAKLEAKVKELFVRVPHAEGEIEATIAALHDVSKARIYRRNGRNLHEGVIVKLADFIASFAGDKNYEAALRRSLESVATFKRLGVPDDKIRLYLNPSVASFDYAFGHGVPEDEFSVFYQFVSTLKEKGERELLKELKGEVDMAQEFCTTVKEAMQRPAETKGNHILTETWDSVKVSGVNSLQVERKHGGIFTSKQEDIAIKAHNRGRKIASGGRTEAERQLKKDAVLGRLSKFERLLGQMSEVLSWQGQTESTPNDRSRFKLAEHGEAEFNAKFVNLVEAKNFDTLEGDWNA